MIVLKGHFDGKVIILDEPPPPTLLPQARVRVYFDDETDVQGETRSLFDEIAKLAVNDDNLPRDFSAQHDHYVRGTPRK